MKILLGFCVLLVLLVVSYLLFVEKDNQQPDIKENFQGADGAYSGGDYSGGDYSGGDYSGGDYSGGDYSGDAAAVAADNIESNSCKSFKDDPKTFIEKDENFYDYAVFSSEDNPENNQESSKKKYNKRFNKMYNECIIPDDMYDSDKCEYYSLDDHTDIYSYPDKLIDCVSNEACTVETQNYKCEPKKYCYELSIDECGSSDRYKHCKIKEWDDVKYCVDDRVCTYASLDKCGSTDQYNHCKIVEGKDNKKFCTDRTHCYYASLDKCGSTDQYNHCEIVEWGDEKFCRNKCYGIYEKEKCTGGCKWDESIDNWHFCDSKIDYENSPERCNEINDKDKCLENSNCYAKKLEIPIKKCVEKPS